MVMVSRSVISWLLSSFMNAAGAPTELLQVVKGAAHWLEAASDCHDSLGKRYCSWKMNSTDEAPANYPYLSTSLYYGSGGVAIFFSQLADWAKSEPRWQALAQAAIEDVRIGVDSAIGNYGINAGFYYGLAGISWSLRTVGKNLPDSTAYLESAVKVEKHILSKVLPFSTESGALLWNNTDIAHGAAGTGLAFLSSAIEESDSDHVRALEAGAVAAGRWLLQQAQAMPDGEGWRWWRGPDTDGEHTHNFYPTFCCGTAGVGYFLAELSRLESLDGETHKAFALAAWQAGKHVLAVAEERDGALLMPHGEQPPDTSSYYLGWCGGAPGWARLFVKLWQATNEPQWLEALQKAVKGTEVFVLPNLTMMLPVGEQGIWQNLGQCCGAAAAGNFLLSVARSDLPLPAQTKADAWIAAQKIAEAIVSHAVPTETGIVLPSAEEHSDPKDTRWQAGWMQGMAGIASFLLDVHVTSTGDRNGHRTPWPDEPWRSLDVLSNSATYV